MILNIKINLDKLRHGELDRVGKFIGCNRASLESDSKYRRRMTAKSSELSNVSIIETSLPPSFEDVMQDLQLTIDDLGIHLLEDGKSYVRLTRAEFKEFTEYDDYTIDHHEVRPDKFRRIIDRDTATVTAVDWLNRPLVRAERHENFIDTSYGRPIVRSWGAQATWYPDGKIFHFDGHVYRPVELFCNCLRTNNECG